MRNRSWKKWIAAGLIAVAVVIAAVSVWESIGYTIAVKLNWGISLPLTTACYTEVYKADTGPSFHGDGLHYHVLTWQKTKPVDDAIEWMAEDQEMKQRSSICERAEQWLDELAVPREWRPEWTESCLYWIEDNSNELMLFWHRDSGMLYVLEWFT